MEEKIDSFIYGRRVLDVLLSGEGVMPEKVYIQNSLKGGIIDQIIKGCKSKNIPYNFVPKEKLNSLVRGNHQGVVAKQTVQDYLEFEELLKRVKNEKYPVLCVLDELNDPHNLGAIMRSSVAFGIGGIIIPKHRSVGLTGGVMKASAGAMSHIGVSRVVNIAQCLDKLKKEGFWIYGADMEGNTISEADFTFPMAVVMGGEHEGIRRLVKEKCDFLVSIPQKRDKIESLNVSVAAGIVFHEIFK